MTSTLTRPPAQRRMDPRIRQRRVHVLREQGRRRRRALLAVLVVTALVGGTTWLLHSPLLSVHRVLVRGNTHTSSAAIQSAVAGVVDRPMISVSASAAESRVRALPWVAGVVVSRSWPSTLVVRVTERKPVAAVRDGGRWDLVDASGRVLAVGSAEPGGVRLAASSADLRPGGTLPSGDLGLVAVAGAVPPSLVSQVAEVVPAGQGQVDIELTGGPVVDLGAPTALSAKLASLETVLAEVDMTGVKTIDVRLPDQPALTRN
jgi:cell division protein FtsQ